MNQRQTFILKLSGQRERRKDCPIMVENWGSAVRPYPNSDPGFDIYSIYNLGKAA